MDSAVIRLDVAKEKKYSVEDEELFFRIVRAAFSQRRKQMINPLAAELKLPKQKLSEMLLSIGIKSTARAEELSMENFVTLCNTVGNI